MAAARVVMTHPDLPGLVREVSAATFANLWSQRGWVIDQPEPAKPAKPARKATKNTEE